MTLIVGTSKHHRPFNLLSVPHPDHICMSTVFSIFSLVIEADPNTQLSQRSALSQPAVTYTALTLTTTLIATTTIIWRIVTMGYHINRNRYRNVIEIILESAALYSIVLIVYMPFIVLPNVTDAMPQAVVAQMTVSAGILFHSLSRSHIHAHLLVSLFDRVSHHY